MSSAAQALLDALDEISTESIDRPRTATANTIDTEIAGLATGLRRR